MQLSYALGLRTKEAVESCKSVPTWKRALESGQNSVRVVFGTKGGRPRDTVILDRDAVRKAISYAEKIMEKQNGKLVDRPDIRKAIDTYRYQVRQVGLTGKKHHTVCAIIFLRKPNLFMNDKVIPKEKFSPRSPWI